MHAQTHGLMPFVAGDPDAHLAAPSRAGAAAARVRGALPDVAMLMAPLLSGAEAVAVRGSVYYSWDLFVWRVMHGRALTDWIDWLASG